MKTVECVCTQPRAEVATATPGLETAKASLRLAPKRVERLLEAVGV